jgi:hypothetical protein
MTAANSIAWMKLDFLVGCWFISPSLRNWVEAALAEGMAAKNPPSSKPAAFQQPVFLYGF